MKAILTKITVRVKAMVIVLVLLAAALTVGWLAEIQPERAQAQANGGTAMICIEASSNRILSESNAYSKKYMASTTKVATAITVIENTDIEGIVTIPKQAVGVEGSSIYLELGERLSVLDLLYGLMLQSGNDAATALAIHVGGSIEGFAKLMNQTAIKAGAKNSNFVNPHGLHDDQHYTTAYDLAVISSYAMKNDVFRRVVGTKTHRIDSPQKGYTRVINNKNKILSMFEGGNGIKTGYTKRAGRCLVASARREGMEVIAVVLNCPPMFEACCSMMSNAFRDYDMVEILSPYQYVGSVDVEGGKIAKTRGYTCMPIYYPLRQGEQGAILKVVDFDQNLSAPIKRNQKIGKIKILMYNRLLFEQKIYSIDSVQSIKLADRLRDLIDNWN